MEEFQVKVTWHYAMEVKHLTCIHFCFLIGTVSFYSRIYNYTPLMSAPIGEVAKEEAEVIAVLNDHVLPAYNVRILN